MKWRLYMINNFKIIENLITTENNDNKTDDTVDKSTNNKNQ